MKEIVGYILIVQAILTGIIAYSILQLGDSIKESAAHIGSDGNISWGGSFPEFLWVLLMVVIGIGIFLILRKR